MFHNTTPPPVPGLVNHADPLRSAEPLNLPSLCPIRFCPLFANALPGDAFSIAGANFANSPEFEYYHQNISHWQTMRALPTPLPSAWISSSSVYNVPSTYHERFSGYSGLEAAPASPIQSVNPFRSHRVRVHFSGFDDMFMGHHTSCPLLPKQITMVIHVHLIRLFQAILRHTSLVLPLRRTAFPPLCHLWFAHRLLWMRIHTEL